MVGLRSTITQGSLFDVLKERPQIFNGQVTPKPQVTPKQSYISRNKQNPAQMKELFPHAQSTAGMSLLSVNYKQNSETILTEGKVKHPKLAAKMHFFT